jgi:hypothetical protein
MVNKFDSPLKLPTEKGKPLVARGEWAWDDCYFASVLILQPAHDHDPDSPPADGAVGIGTPIIGEDPADSTRTIWQLALNGLPGTGGLVPGKAQASALAVGNIEGQLRGITWTESIELA